MVFLNYYKVPSINIAHEVLKAMEFDMTNQETVEDVTTDTEHASRAIRVYKDDDWLAMYYPKKQHMQLFCRKRTNSINYINKRFPHIEYDDWDRVITKRW